MPFEARLIAAGAWNEPKDWSTPVKEYASAVNIIEGNITVTKTAESSFTFCAKPLPKRFTIGLLKRIPSAQSTVVIKKIIFKKLLENSCASFFLPFCKNSLKTGIKDDDIAVPKAISKNKSGILDAVI